MEQKKECLNSLLVTVQSDPFSGFLSHQTLIRHLLSYTFITSTLNRSEGRPNRLNIFVLTLSRDLFLGLTDSGIFWILP
jgi:hypothetical protein